MEREFESGDEMIDLGAASVETKGIGVIFNDEDVLQNLPGLSND
ncbi:benenodin family lasso peptide [Sphingomonas koreensis]